MDYKLILEDILPYSVPAPDGYQLPKNFPFCCIDHENDYQDAHHSLSKFPNCCSYHQELAQKSTFDIKHYQGLPLEIAKKVQYTRYHIHQHIDESDWYQAITDYIDYIIHSIGSYAPGGVSYVNRLKIYISVEQVNIADYKVRRLVDYLDKQVVAKDRKVDSFDLNVIQDTYRKWLKLFPFDHTLFKHLKTIFAHTLPILADNPVYNSYCESYFVRIITKKELIKRLIQLTQQLIEAINTNEAINTRYTSNIDHKKREIMVEAHRVKQAQLVNDFSKKEAKYVKIVKKWLGNEKDFINELVVRYDQMNPPAPQATNPNSAPSTEPSILSDFNNMPLSKIKAWFMQLAEKKNRKGHLYLTKEQVNQFIDRAFMGNSNIPMLTADLGNGDMDTMGALFLIFYEQCKNLGYAHQGDLNKFVRLLTENFTNYNHLKKSLPTNFKKYSDRKNAWPNTEILL